MSRIDTLAKPFRAYVLPPECVAWIAEQDRKERAAFDEKVNMILANFPVTSELAHRHASRVFFKRTPYRDVPAWSRQVIEEAAASLQMLAETAEKPEDDKV